MLSWDFINLFLDSFIQQLVKLEWDASSFICAPIARLAQPLHRIVPRCHIKCDGANPEGCRADRRRLDRTHTQLLRGHLWPSWMSECDADSAPNHHSTYAGLSTPTTKCTYTAGHIRFKKSADSSPTAPPHTLTPARVPFLLPPAPTPRTARKLWSDSPCLRQDKNKI